MKSGWKLLVLAVAAFVVTQLLVQRSTPPVAMGSDAPGFALPDLSGRKVELASLRGRVVAVNFWATWCGPCQLEIPELAEVWRANHDRCFELLGVTEDSGSVAEIAVKARAFGIPYPVLSDADSTVGDAYKVRGYPRTILIDAGGRIRRVFDGAVRKAALEDAIAPLLPPPGSCPRA